MTTKRIMPIAMGLAMIAVAAVQGYAFMMATEEVPANAELEVVNMLEGLQAEMKEDFTCQEKLAKLDAALEQIDGELDLGVDNEDTLLVAREVVVEMRLDLPCQGEQLAQNNSGPIANVVSNVVDTVGTVGGGGGAVGGGSGLLILGGGAAAVIGIAAASSDDDDPGTPASTN